MKDDLSAQRRRNSLKGGGGPQGQEGAFMVCCFDRRTDSYLPKGRKQC